ncbi:MAG: enoyl-CoA hydratase/isomerase family protein [Acidimicrobiales bacterium]|nr:enoyl-CoA hydratase [Acidimicrobiaceae bacterium]MDP6491982.1 enoyl-CoA hydratase/isomerase family protein [Acidimicrobiales bacterium]MDP6650296.1 enoyl-CoA hydratase/isomerase family protein [Acidimicrobiales bacterium]MDP6759709.1 enoyl-CoA hydratase/isomerase family protein [Acidimicrobiales bacterium]
MSSQFADLETLRYEERGSVAWVTLDRPDALNAFTATMQEECRAVWRSLRTNDDIRVVVLTASGDRAFCAGIDRDEPFTALEGGAIYGTSNNFMYDDPGDALGPKANDLWKPVIGAINGMACGGAFYLLAECDILIAAEHATFFDPHVTYGMAAVYEPMKMLTKMPFGEVMRMSLTGNAERITAGTALRMGLVSEVVPGDELEAAATRLSDSIAANPPWAVQGTLRAIWAAQDLGRLASRDVAAAIYAAAMDPGALADGSETFTSGARPEPRLR